MPVTDVPIVLTGGGVTIAGAPILSDVDLTVDHGEFVALMGANGSGKSTLVRALTGLRPLSTGRLELFGTPIDKFRDWGRLGFVPQRVAATSGIPASVWEVVASGRLTHRRLFRPLSRDDRAAIRDALEIVGLTNRAHDGVHTLSGGQQQRTMIARALASRPDLFFLDEPTAGVDLPNQVALADALEILKDRGVTVVLVAHELGPLARLVDRCVIMREGQKAYDGDPISDHWVHTPIFGETHNHHHHADAPPESSTSAGSAPHVSSPFDPPTEGTS